MPWLVTPATDYHASFLAALVEYHEERRHLELGLATLREPGTFARYIAALRAEEHLKATDHSGRVPQTNLWWVDGHE
ncbi:MAG: hypothetical protein ABR941_08685, partial [Thermoleophilia bacterium]